MNKNKFMIFVIILLVTYQNIKPNAQAATVTSISGLISLAVLYNSSAVSNYLQARKLINCKDAEAYQKLREFFAGKLGNPKWDSWIRNHQELMNDKIRQKELAFQVGSTAITEVSKSEIILDILKHVSLNALVFLAAKSIFPQN